jgi:hypothetical protein
MLRNLSPKKTVLALLLTAAAVVGARAQIVQDPGPTRPGFCTGGPFTLTAGHVKFHVALDDNPTAPSMLVILRLFDSKGNVVARDRAQLAAGHTTTLEHTGAGLLRAQATFESLLAPSNRRETAGSVEVFDVDGFRAVIPVLCSPNENIGK